MSAGAADAAPAADADADSRAAFRRLGADMGPDRRADALRWALRYSLNAFDSNVIDVGYAGRHRRTPDRSRRRALRHFPVRLRPLRHLRPATYLADVPFEVAAPWHGSWDSLPAAHAAASVFDGICLVGMLTLGWRLGGLRLGLALATAWAAFPFTAYALESNTNDELVAAALIWGLVLFAAPARPRPDARARDRRQVHARRSCCCAWWRHPFPRGQRRSGWLWYRRRSGARRRPDAAG